MEKRINEGEIKGAIEPVTMEQTKKILYQMNKSVCKILGQEKNGTGFFCELNINNEKIPVLITNFHIIDDKFIESNDKITIQLGNEKECRIIYLNKNKIVFSSSSGKYDIIVIKIVKKDEIKDIQYLEIDNSILHHKSELAYKDTSIYIIHYPFKNEISVSYGKGSTKENDFDIIHKCETNKGSSGSPIFNLSTNKIIGIHKSYVSKTNEYFNLGTFLKYPIKIIKLLSQNKKKEVSFNHIEYNGSKNLQILNIDDKILKRDITKRSSYINNIHKNISNPNLKTNDLSNKCRKINNQQNLKIDNNIYIKNEKKLLNSNQDNFHDNISNSNLGKNNLITKYKKINKPLDLSIDNNIYIKDDKKLLNTNPDNFHDNISNPNLGENNLTTKYKKINKPLDLKINNYIIKNDGRINNNNKNIPYGEIKRNYLNNNYIGYNNFYTNKYEINLNDYNIYQRMLKNNINKNDNIENKLIRYTNLKEEILDKKKITENYQVKNVYNENQKLSERYLNSEKKNYNYDTYKNLKNNFINYKNLNRIERLQVHNSSTKQIQRNTNNPGNHQVNVSVENSQEIIFDKNKGSVKNNPNKKLISTPINRKNNSRKTKSLFEVKIKNI